jgi:hypothetical protein
MFHRLYLERVVLEGDRAMASNNGHIALLSGVILSLFSNGAHAGLDDFAGNGLWSLQGLFPLERAQYSSSGDSFGDNDCWDLYQTNCPTPHNTNPIRDLDGDSRYPDAANHYRGAPQARLRPGGAPMSLGLQDGGVPAYRKFGGAGAGFHGLGSIGVPASSRFMGYAPAFHSFGGGGGFHSFGRAGDFHGGGGAFSLGGHGGIGHR